MTVEIKELVIRAVVKSESNNETRAEFGPPVDVNEQAIVDACVKQVLKILKRKQER